MNNLKKAYFAGGCFWCTEAVFLRLKGVKKAIPGYCGGDYENPTYEQVCSGITGHAETVFIEYDSGLISYKKLLNVFFRTHDPTTINRQGNDVGKHYRSAIFYTDLEQKKYAENFIKKCNEEGLFKKRIITQVEPLKEFYTAENYHMNYYELNQNQPYCEFVIAPKIEKFKLKFKSELK